MPLRYTTILLILLVGILCGCKTKGGKSYNIDSSIKSMFGADDDTPTEMAANVFNTKDPDMRRKGIEHMSNKKWALREPYLKLFAEHTKPTTESDPSVRAVAVRTLGRAHATKYLPEIIAALQDESSVVRWDAAVVVTDMPSDDAILTLQRIAVSDKSPDARGAAATALRCYLQDSVYRTLLRCLDDESFNVRKAAHESLVFQTKQDKGFEAEGWTGEGKAGSEVLPEPTVRYKKRPWWDWMKVTKETESIKPEKNTEKKKRPWWDWFGTTDKKKDK